MIAGPCVIESAELTLAIARTLKDYAAELNLPLIFKASFDKANRTSLTSFRGPGLEKGLEILARVRDEVGLPVLSDVHQVADVDARRAGIGRLADPGLSLPPDRPAGGRGPNRQGGQYQERPVHGPLGHGPGGGQGLCHRQPPGAAHGEGRHVRLQQPGGGFPQPPHPAGPRVPGGPGRDPQRPAARGQGTCSGGQKEYIPLLARAGVAAGVDALFMEVHPDPDHALCDGPNSLPLAQVLPLWRQLAALHQLLRGQE